MRERHEDLRSLADDLKADANRVHDIEDATTREDPRSQRFRDLSAESERITKGMAVKASAQRQLADQIRDDPDEGREGAEGAGTSPSTGLTPRTGAG